jgi:hypothetical protein
MKLGMYIMVPDPISAAYFMFPSMSLLYQRLGKNVTAATNTHTQQ